MNVDINANSKTDAGRKIILQQFANVTSNIDRGNDRLCWDMYNNEHKEAEYDYLRKYGEFVLPAHVRHIPKQRPYLDYLTSRQLDRPYVFGMTTVDKESLKIKHKNMIQKKVDMYIQLYRQRHFQISAQLQQLDQQRQQIMQQAQVQPKNEQEAQAQKQAQAMLPQITAAMDNAKENLTDVQVLNDKTMEAYKMAQMYSDRELMEQWAQIACKSYRTTLGIKQKSIQNFINVGVTGKEFYYVDYDSIARKMIFRCLVPHKVFYQSCDDIFWTQELSWAGFEEFMTPVGVITEFGSRMTPAERTMISQGDFVMHSPAGTGPFVAGPNNSAIDMGRDFDNKPVSSGAIHQGNGVSVKRVWWLAADFPSAIKKPNPHRKGKYFTNIITDGKKVIDEKDHFYHRNTRSWIDRKTEKKIYPSDTVKTYNSEKGDLYETRVRYDRYKGIIINNSILISEKDPVQPRGVDDLSNTWLPIVGPTFNNITYRPYSLIWATKDLQKLYNIVSYHRELMLAVSGTKSFLMDMTQKPEGMSDQEWEMGKKLGNIKIETRKKGIGQVQPTFNQFQMIDMSLSASIQYFDAILENIDSQIGLIMGVTRQSMGQTVSADQVGTFELSQRSTLLITQVLYSKHDEVERQALQMMMRIAKQYVLDEETIIQTIENGVETITRIPGGMLNKADFDIIGESNSKEESSMIELKQLLLQNFKAGILPFNNFISLYKIDSLMELEKKAEYFATRAQELASQSQNAQGQQQQDLEQQKNDLAKEMVAFTEQQKQATQQIQIEWDKTKQQSADAFNNGQLDAKAKELQLNQSKLDQEKFLKILQLTNTKQSEDNVITENARATNIDAKIKVFQLQLEHIQAVMGKDSADKKIAVDDKKATKMSKEHV